MPLNEEKVRIHTCKLLPNTLERLQAKSVGYLRVSDYLEIRSKELYVKCRGLQIEKALPGIMEHIIDREDRKALKGNGLTAMEKSYGARRHSSIRLTDAAHKEIRMLQRYICLDVSGIIEYLALN